MSIGKGLIVAIEGINGSGKTELVKHLGRSLRDDSKKVTEFSFPSRKNDAGRKARESLATGETLEKEQFFVLTAADRQLHLEEIVEATNRGGIVLCDRYSPSEYAYGKGVGLNLECLRMLERPMPEADFVIVLDLPVEEALARRNTEENPDYFEQNPEILSNIRSAYLDLASTSDRYVVLDASQDQAEILSTVRHHLEAL